MIQFNHQITTTTYRTVPRFAVACEDNKKKMKKATLKRVAYLGSKFELRWIRISSNLEAYTNNITCTVKMFSVNAITCFYE